MARNTKSQNLAEQMQVLIQKARDENRMEEIMQVIRANTGVFDVSASAGPMPGSMTDASKRLREDAWEMISGGPDTPPQPMPVSTHAAVQPPMRPSSSGGGYATTSEPPSSAGLPKGLTSVEEWGKTLCQLPKVAKLHLSYAELVIRAQTDKEINTYLGEYILNHKTSSLKVADLKQYLQYVGFVKDQKTYIPGSSTIERKMK